MMDKRAGQASEDQFLGALLGLAIGDALGRPLRGLSHNAIAERFGPVAGYIQMDVEQTGSSPGEITDKTEIALCIVESLTTNDGMLDPVNINARMTFLVRGPSREYMSPAVIEGVATAEEHDGQVPGDRKDKPELAVAVRGVPIGLLHALGAFDEETIRTEASIVSRLSHGGEPQTAVAAEVALGVCNAARGSRVLGKPSEDVSIDGSGNQLVARVRELTTAVGQSEHFEDEVFKAVSRGGETDVSGAIAGAIGGARFGASGIPQGLIDGLDARIYLSMAAPWFYRTALRRAGTVIDLRAMERGPGDS